MAHPVDAANFLNLKTPVLSGALIWVCAAFSKDQDDDEFHCDNRPRQRGA